MKIRREKKKRENSYVKNDVFYANLPFIGTGERKTNAFITLKG